MTKPVGQQSHISVENLHVWSISRGKHAMSVHIKCDGDPSLVLNRAKQVSESYGIDLSTIQVEETRVASFQSQMLIEG